MVMTRKAIVSWNARNCQVFIRVNYMIDRAVQLRCTRFSKTENVFLQSLTVVQIFHHVVQ